MGKILFVGGVFPPDKKEEILKNSIGGMQHAADNLQWKLIEGIEGVTGKSVTILNQVFVGSYPKRYKKWYIPSYEFDHGNASKGYNSGCLNITGIKQLLMYPALKRSFDKLIKQRNDIEYVIFYSAQGNFSRLAKYIKKKYNLKIHMVIPDLPQFMSMQRKGVLFSYIKNRSKKLLESALPYIDTFTVLTKYIAQELKIDESRYTVIEGIAGDDCGNAKSTETENKTIVYTGTLTAKYGVMDLVEAFMLTDNKDYRLVICGDGETRERIKALAEEDKRIIYKGNVSQELAREIQRNATVLVNPRKNNEEYTKFSFPSKLMEYLLSGTPVVCYKLDGMPEEYDEYFNYVQGDGTNALADEITRICELDEDERTYMGSAGKNFVRERKNKIYQCGKIVKLMNIKE